MHDGKYDQTMKECRTDTLMTLVFVSNDVLLKQALANQFDIKYIFCMGLFSLPPYYFVIHHFPLSRNVVWTLFTMKFLTL